jgi:hypothetical protein
MLAYKVPQGRVCRRVFVKPRCQNTSEQVKNTVQETLTFSIGYSSVKTGL